MLIVKLIKLMLFYLSLNGVVVKIGFFTAGGTYNLQSIRATGN